VGALAFFLVDLTTCRYFQEFGCPTCLREGIAFWIAASSTGGESSKSNQKKNFTSLMQGKKEHKKAPYSMDAISRQLLWWLLS